MAGSGIGATIRSISGLGKALTTLRSSVSSLQSQVDNLSGLGAIKWTPVEGSGSIPLEVSNGQGVSTIGVDGYDFVVANTGAVSTSIENADDFQQTTSLRGFAIRLTTMPNTNGDIIEMFIGDGEDLASSTDGYILQGTWNGITNVFTSMTLRNPFQAAPPQTIFNVAYTEGQTLVLGFNNSFASVALDLNNLMTFSAAPADASIMGAYSVSATGTASFIGDIAEDSAGFGEIQRLTTATPALNYPADVANQAVEIEGLGIGVTAKITTGTVKDGVYVFFNQNSEPADQGSIPDSLTIAQGDIRYERVKLNNLEAQRAPDFNDDSSQGYEIGSLWFDQNTDPISVYIATWVGVGDAEWRRLDT